MNFSLTSSTMNSNTHFIQSKLNNVTSSATSTSSASSNQTYLNQQSTLAPRFMGLNASANSFTMSPTVANTNPLKQQNSIGLGHQQQQSNEFNNLQRNFQLNSLYQMNLNLNQTNAANLQQLSTNPTLLASVLAANTTCSLNNTLFVGNLHASLQEMDLVQVFRPFGRIVECCKKWLHFGFVKFTSEEEACHAYVTLNGFRLKGRPMRLEFQNRTKKARIKAILAQAALQATNVPSEPTNVVDSTFSGLSFTNFLNEQNLQFNSNHSMQAATPQQNPTPLASLSKPLDQFQHSTNDCTFFDADQLMKFANNTLQADLDLEPKMKKFSDDFNQLCFDFNDDYFKSKSLSDSNHDNSCALSSSSDSGCRSTSSLAEEDSGIASLQTSSKLTVNKLTQENLKQLDEENKKQMKTLDEDSDGDEDDEDCVSNSDTSDDASDIPESEADSLDLLDDLDSLDACQDCIEPKKFNQIIEKDGSLARKKLEYGIYRSINHTFSLFIEPQDILKKLDSDEYEEYVLFPNGIDMIESYFIIKNNRLIA